MAANEFVPGPIACTVISNLKRLRADRRWSFADLSERLSEVGRPILPTGLHRLENGKRRVDVDDLMGLAAAFEVTPITLLLPTVPKGAESGEGPAVELTAKIAVDAFTAWGWIRGERPLGDFSEVDEEFERMAFQRRSLPLSCGWER